jgi:hypothetical protein
VALDKLESRVGSDLKNLDQRLTALQREERLKIFPMNERQLESSIDLSFRVKLSSFDLAVLSAVLGRAEQLLEDDKDAELAFCEKDSDLQPWDKQRNARPELCDLYDPLGIWVYGDFDMASPERPAEWRK